jgi:hypothetical protein
MADQRFKADKGIHVSGGLAEFDANTQFDANVAVVGTVSVNGSIVPVANDGLTIGATDKKGEDPISRKVSPEDFLATIYQHLGIDYKNITLKDFSGRLTPIIRSGEAIAELIRS